MDQNDPCAQRSRAFTRVSPPGREALIRSETDLLRVFPRAFLRRRSYYKQTLRVVAEPNATSSSSGVLVRLLWEANTRTHRIIRSPPSGILAGGSMAFHPSVVFIPTHNSLQHKTRGRKVGLLSIILSFLPHTDTGQHTRCVPA